MKTVNRQNRKIITVPNVAIVASLLLFSILSISLIWHHGILYFTRGDSFFHLGRALELMLSRQWLPGYAMNSFNNIGSAVMTMYPYLLLYPLAFFLKGLSLKHALLVFYILYTFLAALISYFSSLKFSQDRRVSYFFALIYSFSGEFLAASFYSHVTDIGVYFSAVFIPLVIFGTIYWLRNGKWLMLSIGMSLIAFSNLISVAFIIILLLLLMAMNYRHLSKRKLLNLIKASFLTILTTAVVWLPILRISRYNQIFIPTIKPVGLINFRTMLHYSLRNNFTLGCQSLTIYSLIGIIAGALVINKLPKMVRSLYEWAILIIFISSDWFPWRWLFRQPELLKLMTHLQTTFRVLVVPQMVLEFVLVYAVIKCFSKVTKCFAEVILLVALVGTQIQVQNDYLKTGANLVAHQRGITSSRQIERASLKVNKPDYWPQQALPIKSDLSRDNGNDGHHKIHFIPKGQGKFSFKLSNYTNKLKVPFLKYNGTQYRCSLDGQRIASGTGLNQTLVIQRVKLGYHQIYIRINKSDCSYVAELLSLSGLLIYGLYLKDRREKSE